MKFAVSPDSGRPEAIIRTTDDHLVCTMGVENLLVVHTPEATLVADKRDVESVRKLVRA